MLVSKSKTVIHAAHRLCPGMIGILRRPMYLATRRTAADRLRRAEKFSVAIIVALSHRHFVTKLWGVWDFADEKFLYSQICRLAAKRSAILVQTEGVPVPHSKPVRTKLRDFIVNENPCHTWTYFLFRRANGSYMALRCLHSRRLPQGGYTLGGKCRPSY